MHDCTFVIAWSDRAALEASLRANTAVFMQDGVRVIIVNGGGDQKALAGILERVSIPHLCILMVPSDCFNKCLCLNVGAAHAPEGPIFLFDADVVITEQVFATCLQRLTIDSFVTIRNGIESEPEGHVEVLPQASALIETSCVTAYHFRNGAQASIEYRQSCRGRSICGLILVHREKFVAVGGCHSSLTGWGFEDYDLQIRLQVQGKLSRISVGEVTHLTHPVGSVSDRNASNARNAKLCFARYKLDDFLGTYHADLAARPIVNSSC